MNLAAVDHESVPAPARENALFTICARNYFAQARVLIDSFRRHDPHTDAYIVLIDDKDEKFAQDFADYRILWIEDLGLDQLAQASVKFDVIELSTNVKPHCLSYLLQTYQRVIFLDPDTCVYRSLQLAFDWLLDRSIILTPASLTPVMDGYEPNDSTLLRVGVFNLGFIGVSRTATGLRFLQWWSDRCMTEGFHDTPSGVFVDQKWINLVPCFFPDHRIIDDPGFNMAPWNLHERMLSVDQQSGNHLVNGVVPLTFFHFSSFDAKSPRLVATRQTRFAVDSRPDLNHLLAEYSERLQAAGLEVHSRQAYSRDFFANGWYISPTLRRIYANSLYRFDMTEDPRQSSSQLYRFGLKRRLILRNLTSVSRLTVADKDRYSWHIALVTWVFSITLRIIGPNHYFNLMRYLSTAATIRKQPPLK